MAALRSFKKKRKKKMPGIDKEITGRLKIQQIYSRLIFKLRILYGLQMMFQISKRCLPEERFPALANPPQSPTSPPTPPPIGPLTPGTQTPRFLGSWFTFCTSRTTGNKLLLFQTTRFVLTSYNCNRNLIRRIMNSGGVAVLWEKDNDLQLLA